MTQMARILVADNDDAFVQSATEALNERGYGSTGACDSTALQETFRTCPPDVLVVAADLTQSLCGENSAEDEMVAIVISDAAGDCVPAGFLDTPVLGHLGRPVELETLCLAVSKAAAYRRSVQVLRQVESLAGQTPPSSGSASVQDSAIEHGRGTMYASEYVGVCLMQMYRSLEAMSAFASTLWMGRDRPVCPMFQCPRLDLLIHAVQQTIESLEKTKQSFKSRELGNLRKQLEALLDALEGEIPPDAGD